MVRGFTFTGRTHTEETKRKISEAKKGKSSPNKGKQFSDEWRKNLSEAHKGIKPNQKTLDTLLFHATGEMNWNWRGDEVGYFSLHKWVRRQLGRPAHCSECGRPDSGKKKTNIHWANISKKYLRDTSDWVALCVSCHQLWDRGKIELTILQHS